MTASSFADVPRAPSSLALAWTFCRREWRAQLGTLAAYTAMGSVALAFVFSLVPAEFWLERSRGALSLSWFLVLAVVGLLVVAVPTLVTGEYGAHGDTFVRRLPGALLPSFLGKLLFVLQLAIAWPIVLLGIGEGCLLALGRSWNDLFVATASGEVEIDVPWTVYWLAHACGLVPWVWAVGTWLPRGRMAFGGALLLVLAIAFAGHAMTRLCPGLAPDFAQLAWLLPLSLAGFPVAGLSWVVGRRGGGALRSARVGVGSLFVVLLPPAGWLAVQMHAFFHPDPRHFGNFETKGLSPDLRYALVEGKADARYLGSVPFRVDLQTGDVQRVGAWGTQLCPDLREPMASRLHARARWWLACDYDPWSERVHGWRAFDVTTLQSVTCPAIHDVRQARRSLAAQISLEQEDEDTGWQARGGVRVHFAGSDLCFTEPNGAVTRLAWPGPLPVSCTPCGHGLTAHFADQNATQRFDLTTRTLWPTAAQVECAWLVRGHLVHCRHRQSGHWLQQAAGTASPTPVVALHGSDVLGLLDDDRLLCRREVREARRPVRHELFTYEPATERVVPIALPELVAAHAFGVVSPLWERRSLLPRDPSGCLWLLQSLGDNDHRAFRFDLQTLACTPIPLGATDAGFRLLAWPDADHALLQSATGIDRLDLRDGTRERLFPRSR